jgi:transcriptional regulator with XRE-family HTH domain
MTGEAQNRRPSDDGVIGHLIRSRRRVKGMTLQELANATARSVSYISQLERGRVSPSVRTLQQVCQALDMPMSWLLDGAAAGDDPDWIVRREARRRIAFPAHGFEKELMTTDGGALQLMTVRLHPMGWTGDKPWQHSGETAATVVCGRVEVQVDDETAMLSQGDTMRIPAERPHSYRNLDEDAAELLIVVTPPYY